MRLYDIRVTVTDILISMWSGLDGSYEVIAGDLTPSIRLAATHAVFFSFVLFFAG
jgi:hypothetical protein